MIKISYEVEYTNNEKKRKFEIPMFINIFIRYKDYYFNFSSEFQKIFSNKSLMGLSIIKGNIDLYIGGEFIQSNHFGEISKEKILKKPLYKKVILNMENKIKTYLSAFPYVWLDRRSGYKICESEIEEILDTWQLIIKNIFSERNE